MSLPAGKKCGSTKSNPLTRSLLSRGHAIEIEKSFTSALESCIRYPAAGVRDFSSASESCFVHLRQKVVSTTIQIENHQSTAKFLKLTVAQEKLRNFLAHFSGTPVQRINPDMTIYQLGLDSINVVQLVSMLNKEKDISVSAADILERPKLSELMTLLEQQPELRDLKPKFDFESFETSCRSQIYVELEPEELELVRPCTPVQMGLLAQFLQSKDDYINAMGYELDGYFDISSVMKAWQVLATIHPTLRMGFVPIEDSNFSFAAVTYRTHAKRPWIEFEEIKSDLETLRIESAMKFLTKLSDPPWRVLVSRAPRGIYMQLVMFHGLYDAHSLQIILSDLRTVLQNTSIPPPRRTDDLLEKILLSSIPQRKQGNHTSFDAASSFWKSHLAEASSGRLPCLNPLRSTTGRTAHLSKPCSIPLKELTAGCKNLGITLQAAGQGVWARLLSAYVGDLSIVFGTVLSGRDVIADADSIAFPTIVTLPIAVNTGKSTGEMLSAIMSYNASVRRYQFSPLNHVQRWIGRPNEVMFDTIFALQKLPDITSQSAWRPAEEISTSEVSFDFVLPVAY
jgi:ferricrocin synthase